MKVIKHKDKWYLQSDTGYKEILLSTDTELQKDGVQEIDDDFLEWLVKNPSCKWVEISLEETQYGSGIYEYVIYKREIPKEEPKQETLEKYSERFNNKENEVVNGIFNPENWGRRVVKQETFEDAAEKCFKEKEILGYTYEIRDGFILGAKWQQEQSYNELFEWLASKDYLSDKVDVIQKKFEQFKKK